MSANRCTRYDNTVNTRSTDRNLLSYFFDRVSPRTSRQTCNISCSFARGCQVHTPQAVRQLLGRRDLSERTTDLSKNSYHRLMEAERKPTGRSHADVVGTVPSHPTKGDQRSELARVAVIVATGRVKYPLARVVTMPGNRGSC